METQAQKIIRRQNELAAERGTWETHWQEVADRVLPRQADFNVARQPGEKRTEFIFDATASIGLERFAAAMESMLTPRGGVWHKLTANDEALNGIQEVQEYFEEVNKTLFAKRYSPSANYASQQHETYMSLGAFGTGILFVTSDDTTGGITYKSIHLAECFIAENEKGQIDTLYRRFEMTARQAMQEFKKGLPEKITAASTNKPDEKFTFIHAVYPRRERNVKSRNGKDKAFASCYVAVDGAALVSEGGFEEFPYIVSRYVTAPSEKYGRSPAMTVLPDIKMLNEMSKTMIRQAHKAIDPPLLLSDDGVLTKMNTRPGGLNFGGVNEQGQQLVHPLQTGSNFQVADEMLDQRRAVVNEAFLVTLFQILVDQPNMTATEAMMRAQEKGALLGPTVGRQQSEALGPMIAREIGILSRSGQLPPMPQSLLDARGSYDIEYESPLSKAQRAEEALSVTRTFEMIMPMAQVDPSVVDNFDVDEMARGISDALGLPKKMVREKKERDMIRDQRSEQQALSAGVQAAPEIAGALEKLTKSGKNAAEARNSQQPTAA